MSNQKKYINFIQKGCGHNNKQHCVICFEEFPKIGSSLVKLNAARNRDGSIKYGETMCCKNVIHRICYDMWIGEHNSCPICRRNARPLGLVTMDIDYMKNITSQIIQKHKDKIESMSESERTLFLLKLERLKNERLERERIKAELEEQQRRLARIEIEERRQRVDREQAELRRARIEQARATRHDEFMRQNAHAIEMDRLRRDRITSPQREMIDCIITHLGGSGGRLESAILEEYTIQVANDNYRNQVPYTIIQCGDRQLYLMTRSNPWDINLYGSFTQDDPNLFIELHSADSGGH
jgi:hypothetical protein